MSPVILRGRPRIHPIRLKLEGFLIALDLPSYLLPRVKAGCVGLSVNYRVPDAVYLQCVYTAAFGKI